MKWWEKTVEYTFVFMAAKEKIFNLLLPLDGDVEAIGDTVICKDSQFFIIEFKKTLSDLSGEYKKYKGDEKGFQEAAAVMLLEDASRAHFIIGGKQLEGRFSIEAREYFRLTDSPTTNIKELFTNGLTRNELEEYTIKFTKFKKSGEEVESGGASTGGYTYESVLAVSKSMKRATLIPLHYFNAPSPKPQLTNECKMSPPSRGM